MKREKLFELDKIVKEVLTKNEKSRVDDFVLINLVVNRINPKYNNVTIEDFLLNAKRWRLPSFESITRCRRKLQAEFPKLANKEMQEKRYDETSEYMAYAIRK